MTKPSRLYKYDSISLQTLRNLKQQIIFFGSPTRFNDPYDCAIKPQFAIPTKNQLDAIRAHYDGDPSVPLNVKSKFRSLSDDELSEILLRSCRKTFDDAVEQFMEQRGVTCFSEKYDDLLMWSHYANNSTGMCLEFDTSFPAFEKVLPVSYVSELPTLEVAPELLSGDVDIIRGLFCVKSAAWSYEVEWRGIHEKRDTSFGYDAKCLTGVYFSDKTPEELIAIVCLVLNGQNESVRFYQGKRSATEFKMEFEPFTYTSFIDARRAGLR